MVKSKTPQSLINLAYEVVEWMDGQRDAQFPFCDTYLMWNYSSRIPDLETYNCTFPYWRKHGNTIMEDISIQGTFKEQIAKILVVKGTERGIGLPYSKKAREAYYHIKGEPYSLISKQYRPLVETLEINDYKLFDYHSRGVTLFEMGAGRYSSSGNIWYHNVHMKKDDIVVYVRYEDE